MANDAAPLAKAFNMGSDARLAGLPKSTNPFMNGGREWIRWNQGWSHVDREWGADAGFWPVKGLPAVLQLNGAKH